MVLDGAQDGGARSARRHRGFETLPLSGKPAVRARRRLVPAERHPGADRRRHRGDRAPRDRRRPCPTASSTRSARPASASGATTTPTARRRRSRPRSSPPTSTATARPELVFGTYALGAAPGTSSCSPAPGQAALRHPPPHQGSDGNGIGVPAAPSIADLDGDGRLEIVRARRSTTGSTSSRVPGSGTNCLPWPTGRGNLLRNGAGPGDRLRRSAIRRRRPARRGR